MTKWMIVFTGFREGDRGQDTAIKEFETMEGVIAHEKTSFIPRGVKATLYKVEKIFDVTELYNEE